jgi:hypothetical protein
MGYALGIGGMVDWTCLEMTTDLAFAVIGTIAVCLGLLTLFWGED